MVATHSTLREKSLEISKSMAEHILICAGDPSGDLHAASLVRVLKASRPGLRVTALGGEHLRNIADRFLYPLVGLGGFGFLEPLFKIPQLWWTLQRIKRVLRKDPPQAVIPVDYYGFNIHVARAAQECGIPVLYYVSPQVWASRPERIEQLREAVDRMLVIFPFEEELYRNADVPVTYVGHPLLERLPVPTEPAPGIHIGLLPGSRASTVSRHLPIQLGAARLLRERFPSAQFTLFRPLGIPETFYRSALETFPWIQLVTDENYEIRKRLSVALSVSGTAALENTLLGLPMVIMYRLSAVTYAIAKRLIRVPFVGIPNILSNRAIVPELLQAEATPEKLSQAIGDLLENPQKAAQMRSQLLSLRSILQEGGTEKAAREILSTIGAAA